MGELTTSVPRMATPCTVQRYENVPGVANALRNACGATNTPETHVSGEVVLVVECGLKFVDQFQQTVWPELIVTEEGEYVLPPPGPTATRESPTWHVPCARPAPAFRTKTTATAPTTRCGSILPVRRMQ